MPTDILIYAVIAAIMVFWLRNVLGTRHGDERQRPNPFEEKPADDIKNTGSIIDMKPVSVQRDMPVNGNNDHVDSGLVQITLADKNFDPAQFKENASEAFVIIVTAFAEGDKETLKDLCSPDVYKAFSYAIDKREKRGEKNLTEIHAVRKNEIVAAGVDNRIAYITLRITADETYVIEDKNGKRIAGHPDRVTEMTDRWTFSRDVKSKDPRWLLSKTEDDEIEVDGKTPLPDAG